MLILPTSHWFKGNGLPLPPTHPMLGRAKDAQLHSPERRFTCRCSETGQAHHRSGIGTGFGAYGLVVVILRFRLHVTELTLDQLEGSQHFHQRNLQLRCHWHACPLWDLGNCAAYWYGVSYWREMDWKKQGKRLPHSLPRDYSTRKLHETSIMSLVFFAGSDGNLRLRPGKSIQLV